MALEQFDIRRIRDGVTYNTNVSELLAYADGVSEESGASRWRAGLFKAPSKVFFAVREESRRYFDQMGGRWTDGVNVTLDVLDYAGSLKWCETHDANILVDFIEQPVTSTAEQTIEETVAEPVVEAEPAVEPAPAENPAPAEEPSGVVLSISEDQKSAIETDAQKAGMTLDAYLLHCVDVSRAAQEATPVAPEAAVEMAAAAEAVCDECIEHAFIEVEVAEVADAEAPAETAPEFVEDELALIEVLPTAADEAEGVVLTVAEETEGETASHELYEAQIVPLSPEMLHHHSLAQQHNGAAGQFAHEQADLGQAAE